MPDGVWPKTPSRCREILGAGGGGRTLMTSEGRGILSPVRLPVPPLQRGGKFAFQYSIRGFRYTCTRRPACMALFKTLSAAVYGLDAHLIDVEVDMYKSASAPDFITVGMPDTAVRESR